MLPLSKLLILVLSNYCDQVALALSFDCNLDMSSHMSYVKTKDMELNSNYIVCSGMHILQFENF